MGDPLQPAMNAWAFLILVAAAQGLLLGLVLLLVKRGNRTANGFLAALIFVFSLRAIGNAAYWTKYLLEFPHLFGTTDPLLYLYGPFLFLYAASLISPQPTFRRRYLIHLIPYLIQTGFYSRLYLQSSEFKHHILTNYVFVEVSSYTFDLLFFLAALQLPHMLLYIYFTVKLLNKHARNINDTEYSLERAKIDWLRKLTIGFGGFWGFWALYSIAMILGAKYLIELDYLVTSSLFVIIFGICYMTLKQPEVFSGISTLRRNAKYEKSSLTSTRAEEYAQRLRSIMETDKLFLQPGLKLEDLAHHLSISPYHISQILNEHLHQNFYDFVNCYRIEQAKAKLVDPEEAQFTILSIAFDVGFNNKASFNTAFKKHTGLTPTQFKQTAKKSTA